MLFSGYCVVVHRLLRLLLDFSFWIFLFLFFLNFLDFFLFGFSGFFLFGFPFFFSFWIFLICFLFFLLRNRSVLLGVCCDVSLCRLRSVGLQLLERAVRSC